MSDRSFVKGTNSQDARGPLPASVAGIHIPDSHIARDAQDVAGSCLRTEVFLHSFRSFVLSSLIAKIRKVRFDSELLYIATMLHDAGLSRQFFTPDNRFEVDGANAARALMRRHGRSVSDANVVWDAIALHSSGAIAKWKEPEVALANAGIIADVHGAYLDGIDPDALRELLSAAPRTNFVEAFVADLAQIARSKPEQTQNTFVADVGLRLVAGFHLENFVDEMRGPDPFASFRAE